jgi:hypothetical protein
MFDQIRQLVYSDKIF